ncbi:HAD family hydrolase [Staphylothermus hellenicus]|uniref:HAD family hydrolase n=1 Tax=Staphylothermus hellenicus TaxID=84599 RepID=UPI001FE0B9C3|nr:HAD family hydrolase [Staphylothermus hellenicus]
MSIRAVLLDYDLTLMNNLLDFYDAYNEALKKFVGKTLGFNEFYRLLINYSLQTYIPPDVDQLSFWRYFRQVYRTRYGYPMEGAYYFLYWVKALGLKTIIISGRECHESSIWEELKRFGLDEYIDKVYTMFNTFILGGVEEELFDKTWLIGYVLSSYGLDGDEVVYIGDYRQDLLSARRSGIRFIGIAFSKERKECLQRLGAEYVGSNLYDVTYYLWRIIEEIEFKK